MSQALQDKILLPSTIELSLNPEGEGSASFCFTEQDLKIYNAEEQFRCDLGRSECRLLLMLISEPEEVFSKAELIDFAWAGRVVSEGSLTHAIFNLRSFFGAAVKMSLSQHRAPRYYFNSKYLASVTPSSSSSPASPKAVEIASEQPNVAPTLPRRPTLSARRRKASLGMIAGVLLAAGCVWLLNSESVALLFDNPVVIEKIKSGEMSVNLVGGRHIHSSLGEQHDYLVKELKTISLDVKGEAWLSYTKARYRVACYSDRGATTYAAPMTVSLEEVLKKCLST